MKRLVIHSLIITGLLVAISGAQKFFVTNQTIDWQTYITNKEKTLWNSLESYGIKYAEFIALKEKKDEYKQARVKQNASRRIKELVYTIAQDFNVNPKTIGIKVVKQGDCDAWADKQTIVINEPMFSRLPAAAQQFIVAHELQHIIHSDHEDRYTFDVVRQNANISGQLATDLEHQFYRFQEERADVLAALKKPEYAQAYECCMQNFLDSNGDSTTPEHPQLSYRLKLAQRMVTDAGMKLA